MLVLQYLILRGSREEILLALPWGDLEDRKEVYARELLDQIVTYTQRRNINGVSLSVEVGEILLRGGDIPENEISLCQIRRAGDVTSLQMLRSDILEKLSEGSVVYCYVEGLWRRIIQ
ncbi:MAG: hypothetical protein ACE5IB_07385 [Candidatus Geothermarchaeales archaeon]